MYHAHRLYLYMYEYLCPSSKTDHNLFPKVTNMHSASICIYEQLIVVIEKPVGPVKTLAAIARITKTRHEQF